jgi:hypothetical protein
VSAAFGISENSIFQYVADAVAAAVADAIAKGRSLADVNFPALDMGAPKSNFVMSVRVVSGAVAIDYSGRSRS